MPFSAMKIHMGLFVFIITLFLSFPAVVQAQEKPPPLIEEFSREAVNDGDNRFVTFVFENDSIGRGSDRNYTNGVRLTYFDMEAAFPDFAHRLASYVPTFDINRSSSVYYSIGQNLYTPDNIEQRITDRDDRPWAAFLYGSIGMATLTDNHIDELEATIGIIGPLALGEQVQKAVHKHVTDSPVPKGWRNQLENEPGLMLSWQRRWPQYVRNDFRFGESRLMFSAEPSLGVHLGNVYTYAATGLTFRLSPERARWSDTPLRVRPALPGTGFFETHENDPFDWYLFAGLEGRAVARNIFLDGNTFRDSHNVDKFPLVGDANAGIAFTFGRTRLSYTLVYRSKEFEGQAHSDLFGAMSLSYRF